MKTRKSFIATLVCALMMTVCASGASAATWTVYKPTASVSYTSYIKITYPKSSGATRYYIFRGTSSNWNYATHVKTTTATTVYDYTATPGVKYYYWVCPGNTSGRYSYNKNKYDWGKRKASEPTIPYITASDPSSHYTSYVKLTWPAVSGATSYQIYRSTSSSYSSASRIWTGTKTTVYDDTAKLGYKYYYWVRAKVNGTWYYNSARWDSGARYFVLKVSTKTSGTKLYVKPTVNGLWVNTPWTVTYNKNLNFHWYKYNPYICYFTSSKKGTWSYTIKFGKTSTASVSKTLKVK